MTTRPLQLPHMKRIKRILVAVVGGTVLAVGFVLAVTMQQEPGLQAAEAWILYGASEFPDSFSDPLDGEWRSAFGLFGTLAADERFCGLKAALLSPSLHSYG